MRDLLHELIPVPQVVSDAPFWTVAYYLSLRDGFNIVIAFARAYVAFSKKDVPIMIAFMGR